MHHFLYSIYADVLNNVIVISKLSTVRSEVVFGSENRALSLKTFYSTQVYFINIELEINYDAELQSSLHVANSPR